MLQVKSKLLSSFTTWMGHVVNQGIGGVHSWRFSRFLGQDKMVILHWSRIPDLFGLTRPTSFHQLLVDLRFFSLIAIVRYDTTSSCRWPGSICREPPATRRPHLEGCNSLPQKFKTTPAKTSIINRPSNFAICLYSVGFVHLSRPYGALPLVFPGLFCGDVDQRRWGLPVAQRLLLWAALHRRDRGGSGGARRLSRVLHRVQTHPPVEGSVCRGDDWGMAGYGPWREFDTTKSG